MIVFLFENRWEIISAGWLWLGTALHLVAFCLIVFDSLMNRKEIASTLLWIFLAWSFPVVGPILYLSFGVDRVPVKGWRKRQSNQRLMNVREADREDAAMPMAYWHAIRRSLAVVPDTPLARETHAAMNSIIEDFPLLSGNRADPLLSGDEAFPAMLEAIASAKHHIHLQTFILGNDAVGRMFLDALKAKAEAGVRVRFLYDRFGCTHAIFAGLFRRYARVPNMELAGWTQVNPIKRRFQVNLRNHRKLLVVDGRLAFVGGINLRGENVTRAGRAPIRDYHFRIEGPAVQELQYVFLRDWYFATEADPETLLVRDHFPGIEPVGSALIRIVNGGPESEEEVMTDVLFAAVTAARKTLLAVTPYFVPTRDFVRALRSAALRGVDTRLIVPARNNHVFVGLAGRALYDSLLSAGVRVFERPPPFLHGKALIVDDALAIVGTANLDARSLRLNYETNVVVYDADFIDRLKRMILDDVAASVELDLAVWRRRPLRRQLIENFCYLLAPIL